MICPNCKNDVKSINNICPSCGCALYEKTDEKVILTKQEYIYNKLLNLGLNKYENNGEISKEDELFLKLKAMDMAKENNEIMRKQERYLSIMTGTLIFFVVVTVIAIIIGNFIWIENKEKLSKYSYSYEQSIKMHKNI